MRNFGLAPLRLTAPVGALSAARARRYRRANLPHRLRGYRAEVAVHLFPRLGLPCMITELRAQVTNPDGSVTDYGVLGRRKLTTVGVAAMANAYLGTFTLANFNYGDCGTGTAAEDIGDTALQTPYGGLRGVGVQTSPSGGVYRSVSTITFSSILAITEFGIFSAASVGTLLDRFVFAALNVVSGSSIQFTFNLTYTPGG